MRLSAALIVRDEARYLPDCLRSIRPVVDEIVVVDTGSVDDTAAIAESFGATVLHRRWDDDFSAARNFGLDHVTGDWVLYIDADERLAPTSRAQVDAQLADPDGRHIAMRLRLQARTDFTVAWEYRLWRNRPDIRFEGVIHEMVVPSIRRISELEGFTVGEADLLLLHEGYEGDLTRKHLRNLPMLERQVQNDPFRTYLWDEIGRAHHGLGDVVAAKAAWRHAVDIVLSRGVEQPSDCLCFLDLILACAFDGTPEPELVAKADELFEDNPLILWAGAIDASARNEHETVIERIDRLFAIDPETTAKSLMVHVRVTGDWALHTRGMARFQLGDHLGAAADFAAAEALEPGNAEYRTKRLLAESLGARG